MKNVGAVAEIKGIDAILITEDKEVDIASGIKEAFILTGEKFSLK